MNDKNIEFRQHNANTVSAGTSYSFSPLVDKIEDFSSINIELENVNLSIDIAEIKVEWDIKNQEISIKIPQQAKGIFRVICSDKNDADNSVNFLLKVIKTNVFQIKRNSESPDIQKSGVAKNINNLGNSNTEQLTSRFGSGSSSVNFQSRQYIFEVKVYKNDNSYIPELTKTIEPSSVLTLGRRSYSKSIMPDIDLSGYFENKEQKKEISRKQLELYRKQSGVIVKNTGSIPLKCSDGTVLKINGEKFIESDIKIYVGSLFFIIIERK